MAHAKEKNQWFGKAFEQAIVAAKQNITATNPYPDHIMAVEWAIMLQNAITFITQYEAMIAPITTIQWIGNNTTTQNGDLIIDGRIVEIKYCSSGTGTWFNTTLDNTMYRYGFSRLYKDYMREDGLYDMLMEFFGPEKVSMENASPVSQSVASVAEGTTWYKNYTKKETITRKRFVQDFVAYLKANPEIEHQFVRDAVTKGICNKEMPDLLIVFNYNTRKIITIYDKNFLLSLYCDGTISMTSRQKLGFYAGKVRIAIGWQNNNGLNNPTIRGFITR